MRPGPAQSPGASRSWANFARTFHSFLRVFRAVGPPQVPARGRQGKVPDRGWFRAPIFFFSTGTHHRCEPLRQPGLRADDELSASAGLAKLEHLCYNVTGRWMASYASTLSCDVQFFNTPHLLLPTRQADRHSFLFRTSGLSASGDAAPSRHFFIYQLWSPPPFVSPPFTFSLPRFSSSSFISQCYLLSTWHLIPDTWNLSIRSSFVPRQQIPAR